VRHEDLDRALRRQPLWEPPSSFARRVVTSTSVSGYSRPARVSILDVISGGQRAVVSATFAYAGGWVVWQLTPPLIDRAMTAVDAYAMFAALIAAAMAANASVVAWASAAWSLSIAAWFTRRNGLWS